MCLFPLQYFVFPVHLRLCLLRRFVLAKKIVVLSLEFRYFLCPLFSLATVVVINDRNEIKLVGRELIDLLSQVEEFFLDAGELAERYTTSRKCHLPWSAMSHNLEWNMLHDLRWSTVELVCITRRCSTIGGKERWRREDAVGERDEDDERTVCGFRRQPECRWGSWCL